VSEPLYVSRSRIGKVASSHRRAQLEDGTEIDFGVHGPIKRHFKLDHVRDLPLPVDYIVAATGA
jgi:hypothetical protein